MSSLKRRLGLSLAAGLVVAGLILALAGQWLFGETLRAYFADRLRNETEAVLAALVRTDGGEITLDEQRLLPAYQRSFSGYYFLITASDGRTWRSRSLWDAPFALPAAGGLAAGFAQGPLHQRLLVYRADYHRYGLDWHVVAAQDFTPVLASFERLDWLGLSFGAGALLLVLALQYGIVRRALRPVETVRRQIEELQAGRRAALDTVSPRELQPLIRQVNQLLDQIEQTLTRSRHALGNVSHALKSPVAVLTSLAERPELAAHPGLQQTMRAQLAQIDARVARELARARLAAGVRRGAQFTPAAEMPDLVAVLQRIHARDLTIEWQALPGLELPWEREDMLELLGVLLDNACKWARHRVEVSFEPLPHAVRITVADDGPGIAPDKRAAALERGTRLDRQVPGSGLGLGIAQEIAAGYGAELTLQTSTLGGLAVVVQLPVGAPVYRPVNDR